MKLDPQIILSDLGIYDYKSNQHYVNNLIENGVTQTDIDVLDPDIIDNVKFWELAPSIDPNCMSGGMAYSNPYIANENNRKYILQCTPMESLQLDPTSKIVEIGAGYGAFMSLLPWWAEYGYMGLDIVPRTHHVSQSEDGFLSQYRHLNNSCTHVLSYNTFQHLNERTQISYIRDSLLSLKLHGRLIIAMATANGYNMKDAEGNEYCYMAGQLVQLKHSWDMEKLIRTTADTLDIKLSEISSKRMFNSFCWDLIISHKPAGV